MLYGKRIAAVLFGLVLGLAPSGLVHASTVGPTGTWTYNINLGNGVSFEMTLDGAFGTPGSNITDFNYIGAPAGYVADGSVTTSGNNTYHYEGDTQVPDGGFDQEVVIQYNVADGDYSSTLDYTFAEPTSFWQNTGTLSFDTGDGEYIYDLQGWLAPDGDSSFDGEVGEGANYATYANGVQTDPACTSCTITTTFTPSVASVIPEPSTFTLFGTGVAALFGVYRRRHLS